VAAVHAGWRGTDARIVSRAVEDMVRIYNSNPHDLHAAVGPSMCPSRSTLPRSMGGC
jgi:copper oxidase (laccase) domain-containing protein